MEDSYAPFVDLLDDNQFEEQVVGALNFGDFTHLYEFADGYADFVPWNVVSESRGGSQTPETETGTDTDIETETETEILQKQKQDGGINLEELEFANLHIDEGLQDATREEWFYPEDNLYYPEPDLDTDILQSEMLELLDMFEAVQGPITSQEKMAILRKCIHVCQQIIERGNPIRAPLPQVVTILDEAKTMLQMIEKEAMAGFEDSAEEFEENVPESIPMSKASFKDLLQTAVKEALERADKEEEEQAMNGVTEPEDEDEDIEEDVYVRKGIWYCKAHKLEQCDECNVDHRLLNQARRSAIGGVKVDVKVLRKEQQRLLETESKSSNSDEIIKQVTEETCDDDQDLEDFDSVAKELKEELAHAREMEEADFLNCFASFQISNDRKDAS